MDVGNGQRTPGSRGRGHRQRRVGGREKEPKCSPTLPMWLLGRGLLSQDSPERRPGESSPCWKPPVLRAVREAGSGSTSQSSTRRQSEPHHRGHPLGVRDVLWTPESQLSPNRP